MSSTTFAVEREQELTFAALDALKEKQIEMAKAMEEDEQVVGEAKGLINNNADDINERIRDLDKALKRTRGRTFSKIKLTIIIVGLTLIANILFRLI